MFVEVVHVNGRYYPERGEHVQPRNMPRDYYKKLSDTLAAAASKGTEILYRPNLTRFTHDIWGVPGELERAIHSDPFLAVINPEIDILVQPDGLRKPAELTMLDIATEDRLARKHGLTVALGAYSKICVPSVAHNLSARNPGILVGIDMNLSIDNGAPFVRPEFGNIRHVGIDG